MAQTTVPLNAPAEQPTRRAMLGALAAGVLGGASAFGATEIDPHLRWENEAREFHSRWIAAVGVDPAAEVENMVAWDDRYGRIMNTEPKTAAGMAVQLRAIFWAENQLHPDEYLDWTKEVQAVAIERVVATLEQLASRRALA